MGYQRAGEGSAGWGRLVIGLAIAAAAGLGVPPVPGHASGRQAASTWRFAVTGDSRNCGDVVMPAIAAGARGAGASFFWHLGDFRKISDFDEDIAHERQHAGQPLAILDYERDAWDDFIRNQVEPFGAMPVMLAMGNHEVIAPKTREEYLVQFADWLTSPVLRDQRLRDDPADHHLRTYYHWVDQNIDFITLDNASAEQFDSPQVAWFRKLIARDVADARIRTLVVGMHKPLPDSISAHGMNESPTSERSGREVYRALLEARDKGGKQVYVLASHSHYFMDGIFNTEAWRAVGPVLPGWIIGTGGAVRYPLPAGASDARAARTMVYGFVVGTVSGDGRVDFAFQQVERSDVPTAVVSRYGDDFVRWCFDQNASEHHP
jgi:hypothetical protein